MKRLVPVIVLLAFILPAAARADSPTHIVAYGETLYSIARKYGVSPQALAGANGITTQSWVYAGQRLKIPGAGANTSTAPAQVAQTSPGGMYVVRAGDTLYSVARKFGVTVNALANANDIPPNGFLYTGWRLKIPGAPPAPQPNSASANPQNNAPANTSSNAAPNPAQPTPRRSDQQTIRPSDLSTTYIVQPGDTLYRIAVRLGVKIQAVVIANNLPSQFIYSGQRLTIPGAPGNSTQANNPSNAPANNASFSSGMNLRIADVPVYRQQQTLTCEESAAAMATFGALSEKQIVAAMPRSDNPFEGIRGETDYEFIGGLTHYGTYAQGLQKGLAKLGRQSTTYYGQPYEKFKASILENLRQGRPVIWWTTWRESYQKPQRVRVSNGTDVPLTPYEHTVVIVAATDAGITYNDPYDGSVRFTSWANHQRTSGYFNNMALVVY